MKTCDLSGLVVAMFLWLFAVLAPASQLQHAESVESAGTNGAARRSLAEIQQALNAPSNEKERRMMAIRETGESDGANAVLSLGGVFAREMREGSNSPGGVDHEIVGCIVDSLGRIKDPAATRLLAEMVTGLMRFAKPTATTTQWGYRDAICSSLAAAGSKGDELSLKVMKDIADNEKLPAWCRQVAYKEYLLSELRREKKTGDEAVGWLVARMTDTWEEWDRQSARSARNYGALDALESFGEKAIPAIERERDRIATAKGKRNQLVLMLEVAIGMCEGVKPDATNKPHRVPPL